MPRAYIFSLDSVRKSAVHYKEAIEECLPEAVHALLRQAAALQGRSVSDFVVSSAREAAERAIAEHEVIKLAVADQERFAAELLVPRPAAPALMQAAARHRDLVEPL